jgi:amidase
MTTDDFAWLDASAQADLVHRREVTPAELVDAAIGRIEALNPTLNAVVTPMFERARTAAAGPLTDGPFAGVPFLVKDLAAEVAGVPFFEGSRFLDGYVPAVDCEIIARYARAGLIALGKTTTSEFGLLPTAEPALHGPARNPWDTGRMTGGSSGGSAAAVAAGLVPVAHGNDGGGSIRIPAACCGVFGLKPTRGRVSFAPLYGDLGNGIVAEHVVTRSVRDSAALLDATAGPMPGDPYAAPPPARPFAAEVGADPGRLRIAVSTAAMNGAEVHADCRAAVADAAELCAELGHDVAEAAPALDGARLDALFSKVWTGLLGWMIADWSRRLGREPKPEHFEPWTWRMYEVARTITADDYLMAIQDLQAVARDVAGFFAAYDILLTPVVAAPPLPLGSFVWSHERRREARAAVAQFSAFTTLFNATGQPAMSVPLHWNADGLPIGVQFAGRYGDEATLFRLAAQLEAARPWADRRPPLR